MFLTVTLASAAAAALLNVWLMIRIGAVRRANKITVGDGGNEALQRRMRAQANYIENTPIVLVLIAAIELAELGSWWLPIVAALYIAGRIAHALGMDGGKWATGRMIGTIISMVTALWLAGVATGAVLAAA
ncbi:MAPEG family protein [Altererythrobacter sp. SALINAS58]|uniref:MAPEG family protein n=1 Tax=Alteripontixanthobacter muriae TaxID=2705546 RepID=UPI001575704E|nr:MAPEG family protein [Alteripontixanthobacter muriae]NTZ42773.1 MAPEG family protein [Alteripontixanthobacter muriae]